MDRRNHRWRPGGLVRRDVHEKWDGHPDETSFSELSVPRSQIGFSDFLVWPLAAGLVI
jgi:hypothetical protein